MLGRMQAALLWLLLSVCIQDAASVAELGYWVCSGLCDDGTRILLTNEPGDYKGVRTSESECSMAVATSYALTQCGTGVTKIKNIFSHGPFENSEAGRAAARDFSENVLDATTKYYKNIGVQVGPTTANIPAECVTGTRRVTEEISVAVSKVVGEATCSCHDFVKAAILNAADTPAETDFCGSFSTIVVKNMVSCTGKLNVGPKKFFCDTIIKRVSKVENAVEIIENKAVELVVAPMCNQILTVIDDQTSDSPKSWAKTLKDTNVGTLLDHEIFKKVSNKICAKIFCAGPEAQRTCTRPGTDKLWSLTDNVLQNYCNDNKVVTTTTTVTTTSVKTIYSMLMTLKAPYTSTQFNNCMKEKFQKALYNCVRSEVELGNIQIQSVIDVDGRRSLLGSAGTPNVQQNALSATPPPLTELRAASIKIIVNITNIRDQSHFKTMKLLITDQNIKAAMQNEGLSSEVTILESPTLYNFTDVIVTENETTETKKGGTDGLHTSVMLMVTMIVITVVTSTIN